MTTLPPGFFGPGFFGSIMITAVGHDGQVLFMTQRGSLETAAAAIASGFPCSLAEVHSTLDDVASFTITPA